MFKIIQIVLLLIFFCNGCATTIGSCKGEGVDLAPLHAAQDGVVNPQRIILAEERFGTRYDYHGLAADPQRLVDRLEGARRHADLNINVPIFVIGLEKPRHLEVRHIPKGTYVGRDFDLGGIDAGSEKLSKKIRKAARQVLDDRRPVLLTHVVRFDRGIQKGEYSSPCDLFNIYRTDAPCAIQSPQSRNGEEYDYQAAVDALGSLRQDISGVLRNSEPTHVLVLSTGWNTQQDESLYNYLDWLGYISKAARDAQAPFKPLVILISWESGWDRFLRAAGVATKGNDADEIGLTWVNRLLQDVVLPESNSQDVPVILIGHSYGTRVLGTALYQTAVIKRPIGQHPQPTAAAYIALQAAFPLKRFGAGAEPFFAGEEQPNSLTLITASRHDKANSLLRWKGVFAGGAAALDRVRTGHAPKIIKGVAVTLHSDDSEPKVDFDKELTLPGVYLADASSIVNCNMPGTGGGAHSDVYDREMGQLLWKVMAAAKTKSPDHIHRN